MAVIAKFCGITMHRLIDRSFGTHVHVFHDGSELVIGFNPLRVIQGEASPWVRDWALEWIGYHQQELLLGLKVDPGLATPISRQVAQEIAG